MSRSILALLLAVACGADDGDAGEKEADRYGVGAQCLTSEDCEDQNLAETTGGDAIELVCLTQFAGGYCGLSGCLGNDDCPDGSACVAHDDGTNYCFRQCTDKSECNANRDPDVESNCSANIVFVDPTSGKACVPPSSG